MQTTAAKIAPPTDERRWRLVEAMMCPDGDTQSALIETLHTVQKPLGSLDAAGLQY